MSNNIYFGKSTTDSATSVKKVGLTTAPTDKFNQGDLLAVYFESGNTASEPSISFDPISVADDEGRSIKTQDVRVDSNVWNDGEVVLFCLVYDTTESNSDDATDIEDTIESDDTSNYKTPGYWEAIGKIHASGENCGITKLDGIASDDSIESWLNNEITTNDYNTAINVATVKAMMRSLVPPKEDKEDEENEEDEEEVAEVVYGLQWKQNDDLGEQWTSIGNLSLSNTSAGVSIEIPSELFNRQNIIFTGQLVNNGMDGTNDPTNPDPELPPIEPFLTRYIPNNLFFVPGGTEEQGEETPTTITYLPGNGIALQNADLSRSIENNGVLEPRAENTLPYHVRFDNDKLVLGFNNSDVFKKVVIRPSLEVEGNSNISGNVTASGTIQGNILKATSPAGSTSIIATGNISEAGSLLKNRYSSILMVGSVTSAAQNISANGNVRFLVTCPSATTANWEPVGVIGYNVDGIDTNNPNDALYANVWECFMIGPGTDNNKNGSNGQIQVAIKNINTSKGIKVRIKLNVLYRKKL